MTVSIYARRRPPGGVVLSEAFACVEDEGFNAIGSSVQPGGAYPNEPAGYTRWFSHDWQTWPTGSAEIMDASEVGIIDLPSSVGNYSLISDPAAPHGKGNSLRHRQAAGQGSGTGSGAFDLFSTVDRLKHTYLSYWIYFEPDPVTGDWQFGATHLRNFWGNRFYYGGTGMFNYSLVPPNPYEFREDYWRGPRLWFYDTEVNDDHSFIQRTDLSLAVGQWYQLEYLVESEGNFGEASAGYNECRCRAWVDGEAWWDETTQIFLLQAFRNLHHNMIWIYNHDTLPGRVRAQDDFVRYGDIYVSGVPV